MLPAIAWPADTYTHVVPPLVGRFLIIRAVPIGWGSGRCLRLMPL